MDRDQNEPASDSSISNQDWSLIWGTSQEAARFRAVEIHEDFAPIIEDREPQLPQKIFEQSEDRRHPPQIQEVDPMFLTRCVTFATQIAFPVVFQFVLDFVQENEQTNGNFAPDQANAVIRGGLFDETRFVEYQIKFFTFGGRLGLSLDILDGYAPAVQDFWKELLRALQQNDFTEAPIESDVESDSDYDFLESDGEVDSPFDLEQTKFLNLGESPELVDQMFQDLSNPNFMQQTLLLLAWNLQDAQNFKAVTGDNQAQQLFDTIIACMIATAADFCLPIARCASVLVSQLVDSHDIKVTDEQFNVLVQTLVQWTISNSQPPDEQIKLTSSKEVASILSSQMSKMAPLAANWKDTLEQVYTQAPYDCVRANLYGVIRA